MQRYTRSAASVFLGISALGVFPAFFLILGASHGVAPQRSSTDPAPGSAAIGTGPADGYREAGYRRAIR